MNQETPDGEDWFYSNTVKEHFFNPHKFLTSFSEIAKLGFNGMGIVGSPACGDMMKFWIKVDPKTDKIVDCRWQTFGSLLPGARVMLSDYTTKPVESLKIGDKIIDGNGKNNVIEEILVRNYKGKVASIQLSTSKFYNFLLTPNHPVPAVKRDKVSQILRKSEKRMNEISKSKINSAKVELVPAAKLKRGDFMIFQVASEIRDNKELDADFCTLLGYYVSDGSSPSKNRILFFFNLNETEYVKEISKIAERRCWSHRIFKRNTENVICFQINNPKLVSLLKKHGGLPSKKRFSDEVLLLSPKKQQKIIDAYISGDGWITDQNPNWQSNYFISTSKEQIAYQLQIMLGRMGIFAPIHKRKSRIFTVRGKTYSNSGEFNLIFRKNTKYSRIKHNKNESLFLIPITKIDAIDYSGKIYDPGVLNEPNIYRINGISLHNCASAIASTSVLSDMITEKGGMKIDDALKLTAKDILDRLGGLPSQKIHCSVLGDKALREAVNDYFKKTGQQKRTVDLGQKIIDKQAKVTDRDIEVAVLEGVKTFEDLQKMLKIGIEDKNCIPEAKRLLEFYMKKHFGP
jgi:NifU-like protein involved in Fe-S cluster formation/bacterioferritin-associated ferredoxin